MEQFICADEDRGRIGAAARKAGGYRNELLQINRQSITYFEFIHEDFCCPVRKIILICRNIWQIRAK